jgi:small subunit ribosomal protein S21
MNKIMSGATYFDFNNVRPIEVEVRSGSREDFENALRYFRKLFNNERIIGQLKENRHYEKPSERKRRKAREARERRLQTEYRDRMMASGEWEKRQQKKFKEKLQKEESRAKERLNV